MLAPALLKAPRWDKLIRQNRRNRSEKWDKLIRKWDKLIRKQRADQL